ncbi:MAG: sulfotransferase domain-containing protein [Lachnospiraceae bacterium]|nr:sulfotransferase domain-containing protein [Lachnospiraceae bacterium]
MGCPDFACMGFQKCGTSTLYELLRQHLQIALCSDVKEPMYYRVPVWSTVFWGKAGYRVRYFTYLKKGDPRLRGEVNAGLTFNGCAKKISGNFSPDTKMIFMLRNPVDRSYSAYKYFLARGFLPAEAMEDDRRLGHAAGFDRYVHTVLDDLPARNEIMQDRMKYLVLSQSNYAECIDEYLSAFDRKNMHFIVFEDFVRDEHQSCRELYEFLGIGDPEGIRYGLTVNPGNERAVSSSLAKRFKILKGCNYFLYDLCAIKHWNLLFYKWFRRHYGRVRRKTLEPDPDRSKVLPATRAYLEQYFDADIAQTEKITGMNLKSAWKWGQCRDTVNPEAGSES